jgi:hypothetical protein
MLAARRLKLSNARAEALNNKAKLIVRRAYGFHSAQAALALVQCAARRAVAGSSAATPAGLDPRIRGA